MADSVTKTIVMLCGLELREVDSLTGSLVDEDVEEDVDASLVVELCASAGETVV